MNPGTGKTFKQKMGYNCTTKCPMPKILVENLPVLDIILRFGNMIYDGESISASGVEKALEWSDIPREHWWNLSQRIISYFGALRNKNQTLFKSDLDRKSKEGKSKHANTR